MLTAGDTRTGAVSGPHQLSGAATTPIRTDIQALRAIAVLLVVMYHLWPSVLRGGYIGVDVFLVISGFLITTHLLGEISRTGRISLARFWARRARRLLPASLLVLAVVAIATLALVPDTYWHQYMGEIGAASLYVQNWRLASNAVDYLAAENAASPVQHFWSLSVEEQFYLVWPAVLLITARLSRAASVHVRRRVLVGVMAMTTIASLALSIVWTNQRQASAYFATPTRMWEFSVGGLLAAFATVSSRGRLRAVLSLIGLAAICLAAVTFTGHEAFPGYIALVPVLGTLAVISAGNPHGAWSPARLMGLRPVQFVGDISYSLYLWHWPLIVLVPIVTGERLTSVTRVSILAVSIVAAWASKVFVEARFRSSPSVAGVRPRFVLATALVSTVAIFAAASISLSVVDERNARDRARVLAAATGSCFGAAALEPSNACPEPFADSGAMTPLFAKSDRLFQQEPDGSWECETPPGEEAIRRCVLGNTVDPERTIAMLGDSHALHFAASLKLIAEQRNWQIITYFKSACSGTGAPDVVLPARPYDQEPCAKWGSDALAAIAADPMVDTVVFANARSAYYEDDGERAIGPDRYDTAWKKLTTYGKKVLVIGDVPRTFGGDIPECLAASTDTSMCNAPAASALPLDAAAAAAVRGSNDAVRLLDLTDKFCRDDICHARIGGVIVYSDAGHITSSYAKSLAPYIELALIGF